MKWWEYICFVVGTLWVLESLMLPNLFIRLFYTFIGFGLILTTQDCFTNLFQRGENEVSRSVD